MSRKQKTKEEKQHLQDVAALGCVACRRAGYGETPAEVHHITTGFGTGQARDDLKVIPLCPAHHRTGPDAVHVSPALFERRFGHELELLEQTCKDLAAYRSSFVGGR
ncbi:Ref family recombination enhancement nuclease [Endozoicomonas arenosclerae]|uniref:Ref family recombination enhancement nuclease n=1 Tax=Endozoicomonas arenosclerae TaxID=1633495 RepID=UPI0007834619|nr:Ref family recombination enhancement nuclease [Endozoicomonas arenosclerae]